MNKTNMSIEKKAEMIAKAHALLDSIESDLRFIVESIKQQEKLAA